MLLSNRSEAVLQVRLEEATEVFLVSTRLLLKLALNGGERTVVLLDEVPGRHTSLGGLGNSGKYLHESEVKEHKETKPALAGNDWY